MKDKGGIELYNTMDAVVDVVVDAAVEEHILIVDVDTDIASNTEGLNNDPRMRTVPIPAQSVKIPAQSTKLQQHLQT